MGHVFMLFYEFEALFRDCVLYCEFETLGVICFGTSLEFVELVQCEAKCVIN